MSDAIAPNTEIRLRTRPIAVGHLRTGSRGPTPEIQGGCRGIGAHAECRKPADPGTGGGSRQPSLRHTRAVELTGAGGQLLRAAVPSLERIDSAVRQIRRTAGRKSVASSTWASFASMWLIPRLEAFQRRSPDIDIRIDATDNPVDLDTSDVDLAIRYTQPGGVNSDAVRLFGEQLTR